MRWWKQIDGEYYGVDPIALRSDVNVLCMNARCAVCIDSPEFAAVLFVAIGAQEVGTVKLNEPFMTPGSKVRTHAGPPALRPSIDECAICCR